MEIELKRQLQTQSYVAKSEIQKMVKREEIIALLMLTEELGGQITAQDIVERLLANRPQKIGRRVIEWCASLGVLTWRGEITPVGKESLNEGKVFLSESGIYKFTLTDDPLIPEHLLLVEPSREGNLKNEVHYLRGVSEDYEIEDDLIDLPEKLLNLNTDPENRYNGVGMDGEDIRVVYIDDKGLEAIENYDRFFTNLIVSQYDHPRLFLEYRRNQIGLKPPNVSYETLMQSLLGQNYNLWDTASNTMKFSFEDLNESELRSFQKSITFQKPSLPNLGSFSPIAITMNVQPLSQNDALLWYRWLIIDEISGYFDQEQFKDHCSSVSDRFTEFSFEPPSQKDIANQILEKIGRVEKYWFLKAPLDLQLGEG